MIELVREHMNLGAPRSTRYFSVWETLGLGPHGLSSGRTTIRPPCVRSCQASCKLGRPESFPSRTTIEHKVWSSMTVGRSLSPLVHGMTPLGCALADRKSILNSCLIIGHNHFLELLKQKKHNSNNFLFANFAPKYFEHKNKTTPNASNIQHFACFRKTNAAVLLPPNLVLDSSLVLF